MSTVENITTADDLLQASGLGRCELVRGKLIMMSPAGFRHGRIALTVGDLLRRFISEQNLGVATGAETGFHIASDPDTVRAPDAAFVRTDRLPEEEPVGFFPGPPDLAVEVLSPSDTAGEVLEKTQDWLDAGCRAVWIIDPKTRTVTVYRSRTDIRVLTTDEDLDGGEVLSGFRVRVDEVFA